MEYNCRRQFAHYIVNEFKKAYPNASTERIEEILRKGSDDEIYRLADAINRFGVKLIVECSLIEKYGQIK